jgi:hypothetical protein
MRASLKAPVKQAVQAQARRQLQWGSDRQALAALGPPRIDDRTPTTGLHANQKAVGASAANLGGLISAFHFEILRQGNISGEPSIIAKFPSSSNGLGPVPGVIQELPIKTRASPAGLSYS